MSFELDILMRLRRVAQNTYTFLAIKNFLALPRFYIMIRFKRSLLFIQSLDNSQYIMLNHKAIRFLVGKEKSRNIFVFQQKYPHYILEIITGKKYFYITEKKTTPLKNRTKLLQEIDVIKKKISNIKNERF